MREDFAIFICTHGRPDRQLTLNALLNCGYTGKVYLVLDDTDITIQQYIDNFGSDMLLIFNKNHYINTVNTSMSHPYYKCILYAKCAVEDIAKNMELSAFVIADDDLTGFSLRYPIGTSLKRFKIRSIDEILTLYIDYLLTTNTSILGIGHGGTYFGGVSVFDDSTMSKLINLGVPYNFIFRNVSIPISWTSAFGEDDVTNNANSIIGNVVSVLPFMQLSIVPSGSKSEGGMQEVYVTENRFKLMFYIFLHNPTSVKLVIKRQFGVVQWDILRNRNNVCPKIMSESYRKEN